MTPDLKERRAVVAFIRYVARRIPRSFAVEVLVAYYGMKSIATEGAANAVEILKSAASEIARGEHITPRSRSERASIVRYLTGGSEVREVIARHVRRGDHLKKARPR